MVYHYFPQKYATVDYANGLTQEQLDAVRLHSIEYQEASRPFAEKEQDPMEERLLDDSASPDSKKVIGLSASSRDVFWKEEKRPSESSTLLALTQMALPSNDIMACAMTG